MKFVIDAQLPRRMADWLKTVGHDAVHTFELPDGNRTKDTQILELADSDMRVVITKDEDFVTSHLLDNRPEKLLLISTGNITNQELETLFKPRIVDIALEFLTNNFLEIDRSGIIIRG